MPSPPSPPPALFGSEGEKYGQTILSNKIEMLFVNTHGEHIMNLGHTTRKTWEHPPKNPLPTSPLSKRKKMNLLQELEHVEWTKCYANSIPPKNI